MAWSRAWNGTAEWTERSARARWFRVVRVGLDVSGPPAKHGSTAHTGGDLRNSCSIADLIEAGTVTPVIDRTYPLGQVPDAIRYLKTMRARGKVVITLPGAETD